MWKPSKEPQEDAKPSREAQTTPEKDSAGWLKNISKLLRKAIDKTSGYDAELRIASDPKSDVVILKELATMKYKSILKDLVRGKINVSKAERDIKIIKAIEGNPKMLGVGFYNVQDGKYEIMI